MGLQVKNQNLFQKVKAEVSFHWCVCYGCNLDIRKTERGKNKK